MIFFFDKINNLMNLDKCLTGYVVLEEVHQTPVQCVTSTQLIVTHYTHTHAHIDQT